MCLSFGGFVFVSYISSLFRDQNKRGMLVELRRPLLATGQLCPLSSQFILKSCLQFLDCGIYLSSAFFLSCLHFLKEKLNVILWTKNEDPLKRK